MVRRSWVVSLPCLGSSKALVAEDECALAWVVNREAWVVDGKRDAVEVAHHAAAGVSILKLAVAGTPSLSPASPVPSSSSTSPHRPACLEKSE